MAFIRNCLIKNAIGFHQIFNHNSHLNKFVNPVLSSVWNRNMASAAACKVALITGGALGIGYEMANALLLCGARAVLLGDVRVKEGEDAACKLNKKYGEHRAHFMKCDVTKKQEFEAMFKTAMDKYREVNIVINNAGLLQDKNWSLEVDVNAKGVVEGTLLGFEYMGKHKKGKGGVIVNVASIYGLQQAHACPIYNGTKAFVLMFSNAMSHEYYESMTGVKVFTICPGVTDTNMIDESAKYGLQGFGDVGKMLAEALANLPGQPADTVGKCLSKILCANKNGAIFVIEKSECYPIKLADRHKLRVCD